MIAGILCVMINHRKPQLVVYIDFSSLCCSFVARKALKLCLNCYHLLNTLLPATNEINLYECICGHIFCIGCDDPCLNLLCSTFSRLFGYKLSYTVEKKNVAEIVFFFMFPVYNI